VVSSGVPGTGEGFACVNARNTLNNARGIQRFRRDPPWGKLNDLSARKDIRPEQFP